MKLISFLLIALLSFSCATNKIKKEEVQENVTIVGKLKGSQYKNVFVSAQPGNSDYKKLADNGFKTVINLRSESEYKEDVEAWLVEKKYKMNYYNIPFTKNMELTDAYVDEVTKAVKKHRGEGKVLLHCSSGNRVGAWAAAHFHKDHGMSEKESLEVARKLGLNKEDLIKKVETYFSK